MTLKTATVLAIIGASLMIVLNVINLFARFFPMLVEIVYINGGVIINILHIAVWVTYLIFFITLFGKQK